ncbi:MAG: ribonuclease T [Alphaproteobacteria bacterium]|nr:ribonuclease T [Alphaproteobacteria bacterium]MDE2042220.1 ribonuclease T [Alphaproteobacteria bacterium]MDE2340826.1 ribonuclease T [Alphaproteobacteria bacterium]
MAKISQILAMIFGLTASAALNAQSCTLPADIRQTHLEAQHAETRQAKIGGYLLSFSWSPEVCFNAQSHPHDSAQDITLQCGPDKHFGFVLHGLWPEGQVENGWPQYCRKVEPVAPATLRKMLCHTPSVSLIEHEWEKHGSCAAPTPEVFFAQSARLADAVRLPSLAGLTRGQVNASAVRATLIAANPRLPHNAIGIRVNKGGWLEEVRLCLDTGFHYRACPSYSIGAQDGDRIKIARIR